MSCDIDDHITAKYDIRKRIGKGVRDFVDVFVWGVHTVAGQQKQSSVNTGLLSEQPALLSACLSCTNIDRDQDVSITQSIGV